MNFNFSQSTDYDLNTSLITECIQLYGLSVKFLIAQKINRDDIVFGDFSHVKTNASDVFDIMALPENSESYDQGDYGFNQFGLNSVENISLFISRQLLMDTVPTIANQQGSITGNLIVLPNNKIMEITSSVWEVPGVNNLFTSTDVKSVIKLICKPYDSNLTDEIQPIDVAVDPSAPYNTLDVYFAELVNKSNTQNTEAEVTPQTTTVQKTGPVDVVVVKPTVDVTERDVWGNF